MAKRKAFYLYKRKKKHGSYWYVCFINPDTGAQENAKSIDVLKERLCLGYGSSVTSRDEAAIIANKALEAGLVFSRSASMSFNQYCQDFWDWDKSDYIRMRNSMKEGSVGKEYCRNMLGNYINHVRPFITDGVKLSGVTVSMLDKVVSHALSSGLATGTVQMVVLSFSVPLKEAARRRLIAFNPANHLMKIPRKEKERGVLSDGETRELVSLLSLMPGDKVALAVKLALVTGMRLNEIRALDPGDITTGYLMREDGTMLAHIAIEHSLAPYSGVKSTKNRKGRQVLIEDALAHELLAVSGRHVFSGDKSEYISPVELRKGFYALLEGIGIGEEERKRRNLSFHSLRHGYNTMLFDSRQSDETRMLVLGHSSLRVNERYLHESTSRLVDASLVSSALLHPSMPSA